MRIGVISDTHGIVPAWNKAIEIFGNADLILHAGDVLYHPPRIPPIDGYDIPGLVERLNSCPVPLVIARGNCDPEVYSELLEIPVLSPYAFLQFQNLRILVHHGHAMDIDSLAKVAGKYEASIIVTGHTHLPVIDSVNGLIHINPGSPAHPKFELEGRLVPTVGLIEDDRISIVELETGREVIACPIPSRD